MADDDTLSPEQVKTLVDVLTHHETYREIEQFKSPQTILDYGPPFQDDARSSTPILQSLVSNFVLALPGLRDVSPDFWKVRVQTLISDLAEAELSESYDKGNLGIRKTLATAISSLIEYPARGLLGAFPKDQEAFVQREYDVKNPDDVLVAWQHFLQHLVYGDLFDVLYEKTAQTQILAEQGTLTQAAHEFIVVNLASFMHYALILSPEGPTMVRMLDAVNKLAPYGLVRQTLRIGNVATMLNGMIRLMLAKVSVGSFTNWMGMSTGADEGMNLMQQIVSTVLGWDKRELRKRAEKIEKDKNGPSEDVRNTLNEYTEKPREEHLQMREQSRQSKMSIVQTILSLSPISPEMDDKQHLQALEYLSVQLAVRDRNEIIRVLCKSNPDHLTQAVRDAVAAYEPLIRQVHNAVNLSDTVLDFQNFINDMLKLAKPEKTTNGSEPIPPGVEDFVQLLHTHQMSCHKFLHQVSKNEPEITGWFRDYCHKISDHLRQMASPESKHGQISTKLTKSFASLPAETRTSIKAELDNHASYLKKLHEASAATIRGVMTNETTVKRSPKPPSSKSASRNPSRRPSPGSRKASSNSLRSVLGRGDKEESKDASPPTKTDEPNKTMHGPGAYLARWQHLLDTTLVTPNKPFGEVRTGKDTSVREESIKDVDGETEDLGISEKQKQKLVRRTPDAPVVDETLKAFTEVFRELLREKKETS
ncbi:PX domain-containing protein [Sphaceloma murrayae]|uniref:PX domain-containing protein n=1 Tax=Sphaceloma murrayae TaxID=2082308 RepID=A0A2K1QYP6_9PEZI|nr:PX domain-containing protein [Sphaceloma murrayae]